jgi:hypothetical protein
MAESITWATQAGGYSDRSPRQFFWDVKAFDYCAPFQFGTEIPVAKDVARCMLVQGIFGEGWYGVEATHVWSSDEAVLSIPHVDGCSSLPCELRIEFVPFAASKERPVTLTIGTGGRNQTYTFTDQGKKTVAVPLPSPPSSGAVDGGVATRDSRVDVALHVDNAISPRELGRSADPRTLGISLTGIGVFSISKPH